MADEAEITLLKMKNGKNKLPKFSTVAEAIFVARDLEEEFFKKTNKTEKFLENPHNIEDVDAIIKKLHKKAKRMQAFRHAVYELRNSDPAYNSSEWSLLCAKADRLVDNTDKLNLLLSKDKDEIKKGMDFDVLKFLSLIFLLPFATYNFFKPLFPEGSKMPLAFQLLVTAIGGASYYLEKRAGPWFNAGKEITTRLPKQENQAPHLRIVNRQEALILKNDFQKASKSTIGQEKEQPEDTRNPANKFRVIINNGCSLE